MKGIYASKILPVIFVCIVKFYKIFFRPVVKPVVFLPRFQQFGGKHGRKSQGNKRRNHNSPCNYYTEFAEKPSVIPSRKTIGKEYCNQGNCCGNNGEKYFVRTFHSRLHGVMPCSIFT
jgi:hypothetical protein